MNRKPDQAALARVDARKLTGEFEWAVEDFKYYSDWRNQIAFYREQADNLPDQSRRIETENGFKAGARAILDWQIDDAEQAAEAGHIGRFGLHIQAIVTTLHNAQLQTIEKAIKSAAASKSASHDRPSRQGTLLKIIKALEVSTTTQAEQAFKDRAQIEIDGRQLTLSYHPEDEKPFHANGECWNRGNLATRVSTSKNKS